MESTLITGASGMLGRYLMKEFSDHELSTLGRGSGNKFICDLKKDVPDFKNKRFDTVIHCAGTEDEADAFQLNYSGTLNLLTALEGNLPQQFVFISSCEVYSPDAGEDVAEGENLWAAGKAGESKARTEEMLREWANKENVTLTIIRPALMFGDGVGGKTLELFNDALNGRYIHIRGNNSRLSIVTAHDVARGIRNIYKRGGIYNAADGTNPRLIDLVESMTENAGARKRMTHLPEAWAEWTWRLGRWIPFIDRHLNPAMVERRFKTLTIDGRLFAEAAGIEYFNTLEVMEHKARNYPYFGVSVSKENKGYEA